MPCQLPLAAAPTRIFSYAIRNYGTRLGNATLASKNVGTRAITSLAGLTLNNSNYTLEEASTAATVAITAVPLHIETITHGTRVYNGGTVAAADLLQATNLIDGDVLTADFQGPAEIPGLETQALHRFPR